MYARLSKIADQLDATDRALIIARYVDKLTLNEIAVALRLAPPTVLRRYLRIIELLQSEIAGRRRDGKPIKREDNPPPAGAACPNSPL